MAIFKWHEYMLPTLKALPQDQITIRGDLIELVAEATGITESTATSHEVNEGLSCIDNAKL